MIRPAVSMPTIAVVSEASMRWFTRPAVVRSAVTSMPVITAYIALPCSSRTMLVFQTIRSLSPDLVSASRLAHDRYAGAVRPHEQRLDVVGVGRGDAGVPDLAAEQLVLAVAGDHRGGRVDADHDALEVGHHDDAVGGVEGGVGERLGGLEAVPGVVLRGDVEQLGGEERLVAGLAERGDLRASPGRSGRR